MRKALKMIRRGRLQKLVPARECLLQLNVPVDPRAVLAELALQAEGCFLFFFRAGSSAFLGISPERLFRRDRESVFTEAVAGTRPRGLNASFDRALADNLRADRKEIHEHRIVADSIKRSLTAVTRRTSGLEEPRVVKRANVQHLELRLQGELRDEVGDAELLDLLHPTPAVAGAPGHEALISLEALEPFDRGWYAGPVGWIGTDSAEFAVGIRSALIYAGNARLYSGAGIVEGSDPGDEWIELDLKIQPMLRALGL